MAAVEQQPPVSKKPRKPFDFNVKDSLSIREVNGEKLWVCNWTNALCERRVVIPGHENRLAFANVPCAVSYVEHFARDDATAARLKEAIAERYEQPHAQALPSAPGDLTELYQMPFSAWMQDLAPWDEHTRVAGETVEEYRGSKRSRKRRKKSTTVRHKFVPGIYWIKHQGITEKHIRRLETAVEILAAERKLRSFARKHEGSAFTSHRTKKCTVAGVDHRCRLLAAQRVYPVSSSRPFWRHFGSSFAVRWVTLRRLFTSVP